MSRIAIDAEFFTGKSSEVAKGLIGATILSKANNMKKYFVRETESYDHDEVDNNGKLICYGAAKSNELHLYKSKPDYIRCHGEFSLSDGELRLIDRESDPQYITSKRVNIYSDKKLNFKKRQDGTKV